jgi:DNA repair ATPase RecN
MSTTQTTQLNYDPKVVLSSENLETRKPQASKADKAMFLGMITLLKSIERSEEVGASLSDLSKTLYDTVVTNGTEKIKDLQEELEVLDVFLEGFDSFPEYTQREDQISNIKNTMAELEPLKPLNEEWDMSDALKYAKYLLLKKELEELESFPDFPEKYRDKKDKLMELSRTYNRISGARAYVNGVSQQLSAENQIVSSNKQLPDGIQSQVKTMVLEQGVLVGQMMSFIRIIQRQLQNG